jgi:hypothetical protein
VGSDNQRLAPAEPKPWGDIAGVSALLQQFLDHAQRNPKTVGDLGPGALVVVVGSKDSFPKIQR